MSGLEFNPKIGVNTPQVQRFTGNVKGSEDMVVFGPKATEETKPVKETASVETIQNVEQTGTTPSAYATVPISDNTTEYLSKFMALMTDGLDTTPSNSYLHPSTEEILPDMVDNMINLMA